MPKTIRRRPPLTQSERHAIEYRLRDGDDPKDVALDYCCTPRTVRQIGNETGALVPVKRAPRQLTHKPVAQKAKTIRGPNIYESDVIRPIPLSRLMAGK